MSADWLNALKIVLSTSFAYGYVHVTSLPQAATGEAVSIVLDEARNGSSTLHKAFALGKLKGLACVEKKLSRRGDHLQLTT
jgi:hypothetical protein